MSQKFHIRIGVAAAILMITPFSVASDPLPELARFFNDCAGRLAGHIAINGSSGGNGNTVVTRDHLESIDAIVSAVTTPDHAPELAAQHDAARAAHVALLAHAMAYGDLDALYQARSDVTRCREAVLVP